MTIPPAGYNPWSRNALIALNVLFFFVELMGGDAFIETWAFIPSRFLANPGGDIIQWSGRIREFSYENLQVNGE